jgi:hypothetical protein
VTGELQSNEENPIELSKTFLNQSTTEHRPRALNPFEPRSQPRFIRQTNARPELMVVSQPKGVDLWDLEGYDYIRQAGQGITIYFLDTGANIQSPVCIFIFS